MFLEEFQDLEETAASLALEKELHVMHSLVDKLQGDIVEMKGEEHEIKENVAKLKQSLLEFEQCATKLVSKQDETYNSVTQGDY